jgi:signal transduction histidine kinase
VLEFRDQSFVLEIDDDGVGFDVAQTLSLGAGSGSFGLVGMSERTDLFGGTLSIKSQPDEGTCIRIELPIPMSGEDEHGKTPDQARAG